MEMQAQVMSAKPRRAPCNKGKLIGQKPPLRPKHVWSIRTRLQMEGRTRDLAMFNLALDSKLRGCDVVALRVEDGSSPISKPVIGSCMKLTGTAVYGCKWHAAS